ncbi:c-type cytochrome [Rhizosaccharibacter radicis]|uniref:Cytochrome c n=1 Tax=Rhizosaccharibacter radicis TaxID=2782605 RepID=A0ABT1VWV0_9PROT|nr:cytochrome c [Acetobacteraceae bacterium KSS12]
MRFLLPVLAASVLAGTMLPSRDARADAAANVAGGPITSHDGATLYRQLCQGCHMANAKGAVGAATIPALAGNPKLASGGYPVYVILNGYGAMPWFSGTLDDAQIAALVNYVRTNFGNHYTDGVKPEDVAAVRTPTPEMEK